MDFSVRVVIPENKKRGVSAPDLPIKVPFLHLLIVGRRNSPLLPYNLGPGRYRIPNAKRVVIVVN